MARELSQRQKKRQRSKALKKLKNLDINITECCEEIEASSLESSVYIGADSKTFKRGNDRFVAFCTTVILHKDSKHGGKIFKDIKIERDFGESNTPRMRLMNEVYKVIDIASQIVDSVGERHFEVHLDVNPDPKYKSNSAVKEACGMVLGTFGFEAKIKPEAWAASAAADRFAVKTATTAQRLARTGDGEFMDGVGPRIR